MSTKNTTKTNIDNRMMPLAITQEHVDIMLKMDTQWIEETWDDGDECEWEMLYDQINQGNYKHYPFMLYGGNKAQRHTLHKKLGSAFSHSSIDMDDGSRVMIIVNKPGYIYTYNEHAVCFFESEFKSRRAAVTGDDSIPDWKVRAALDKMYTRGVAEFLPQQQYESKSAADERKDAAQTINKWRESVNRMIGSLETEKQEKSDNDKILYDGRVGFAADPSAPTATEVAAYEAEVKETCECGCVAAARRAAEEEEEERDRKTKQTIKKPLRISPPPPPSSLDSDTAKPQAPRASSTKIATLIITGQIVDAIRLASETGVSPTSDTLEGRLMQGDFDTAIKLAIDRVTDANYKAFINA